MIVNCDINCRSFETQHVSNVAFSNRDIIEITCFWTVISSNCVISAFNYILSANCPIYPLFSLSLCVSLEQRCNRSFMKLIFFWQLVSFFLQINFFLCFWIILMWWCQKWIKKILFWCVFFKNTSKSYRYPKHPYVMLTFSFPISWAYLPIASCDMDASLYLCWQLDLLKSIFRL
jgi:hypothetical protein